MYTRNRKYEPLTKDGLGFANTNPPAFRSLVHIPLPPRDSKTPAKDEGRVKIYDLRPGATIEASNRQYKVDSSGTLRRVTTKPAGTKKERRKARKVAKEVNKW